MSGHGRRRRSRKNKSAGPSPAMEIPSVSGDPFPLPSTDRRAVCTELEEYHDNAHRILENAIQLHSTGRIETALGQYKSCLEILDKALNIKTDCLSRRDMSWAKAMIEEMKITKGKVLSKIADIENCSKRCSSSSALSSYEQATSNRRSRDNDVRSHILTNKLHCATLQDLLLMTGAQTANILYSHSNVYIYFISHDGTVRSTSEPDTLNVVELQGPVKMPRAYLQVGDWIYPLVPGTKFTSPCVKTEYGAFILPDPHSPEEGGAVGIILPEGADASVLHELLNAILCGIVEATHSLQLQQAARPSHDLGFLISQGIVKGAQFLSNGLIQGAERASQFMNYGTPKLIQNIQPGDNPTPIDPQIEIGLRVAKNVTQGAVIVTDYIASRVGTATTALASFLAPHIQREGARVLSTTFECTEQEARNKVDGVLQVAAGAVTGFSTVYDGLQNAAKILGNSLTTNTVKIVQHMHGQAAGAVTGDALYTVGNVFVAGNNIRRLTPKGLVKATAKETGKAVVQEYRRSLQGPSGNGQFKAGSSFILD